MKTRAGKFIKVFFFLMVLFSGVFLFRYQMTVHTKPLPETGLVAPVPAALREADPFIGTGGWPWVCAHNHPGAQVPYGMVRLGPETAAPVTRPRALNTSGYYYGDSRLLGFSHTRLVGTGATEGGHFLFLPLRSRISHHRLVKGYTLPFSHRWESASPGYYALRLRRQNITVELTATPRCGIHRYTFRDPRPAHLILEVGHTLGNPDDYPAKDGFVRILPSRREVEGHVRTFGTFARRYGGVKVYFVARFDTPFQDYALWDTRGYYPSRDTLSTDRPGAVLTFARSSSLTRVTVRVGLSYVSLANARENLEKETAGKSFDTLLAAARQAWLDKLTRIRITGGTPAQRRIFYTALFRTFEMPTLFTDVNGRYRGFDRQVHVADTFRYFTDMSLWDTYRTVHPLYTLIAPDDQRDMVRSLLTMARQGGWLPRWPAGYGYTNSMLGSPADIVISETFQKGIRNFDARFALDKMTASALGPHPRGAAASGRRDIALYLQYHYVPADLTDEAVSKTLEYAWADDAIARLAAALGRDDTARLFRQHAQWYSNTWNPKTKFFHPRNSNGSFSPRFKPRRLTYLDPSGKYTDDYVEGSAWQWRWGVPWDPKGLIKLFGDTVYFIHELNTFFEKAPDKLQPLFFGPYYWHGNQPDLHAAWLFNEAGRPGLTQKWVRWILEHKYADTPTGLEGNDDGGTLSAWYIWASLGIYPLAGTDTYELTSPLFPAAEVNMGKGKILHIRTRNYAPEKYLLQEILLNGRPLHRYYLKHQEIRDGGTLTFIYR